MRSLVMDSVHEQEIPPFNPVIANGVAVKQMRYALEHIDTILRLSEESFPPGLKYTGCRLCTPQEEYNYRTAKRGQHHTLELARSDVFLVQISFSYEGVPIPPRPVYIPFVNKAGIIHIRGKRFTVQPVLVDETLSVSKGDIFVPFLSAKVTFKRKQYYLRQNGLPILQYFIYSKIHRHDPTKQNRKDVRQALSIKCESTMAHYLFCKFGIHETFRRFGRGTEIHLSDLPLKELQQQYPPSAYTIFESSGQKPKAVKNPHYLSSPMKIVIANEKITQGIIGLVTGFYYVVDHFPDRLSPAVLDGTEDEIRRWRMLLGQIIFRNNENEGELVLKMNEHFQSLDSYLDDMTREGLKNIGYTVHDFYDLLAVMIYDYSDIILETNPASLYGKQLAVTRYVLADIVKDISIFKFKIQSIKNKVLTPEEINKHLINLVKSESFFNNQNRHNEIASIQSAGDNMMFNHTSKLILQENATKIGNGKGGTSKTNFNIDQSKLLDPSLAVAGSILVLPKSNPTGHNVLNPYLQLTSQYHVVEPNDLKADLAKIAHAIRVQ